MGCRDRCQADKYLMRNLIDIIEKVEEADASRVVKHIREGAPFVLMSAMRSGLEQADNIRRTKKLQHILNGLPVTYMNTEGQYWEAGAERPSHEISFFVLANGEISTKHLHDIGVHLLQKFDQDSIIFGDGDDIFIINDSGEDKIGNHATFDLKTIDSLSSFTEIEGHKFSFTPDAAPRGATYAEER